MVKALHLKTLFWLAVGTWAAGLLLSGEELTIALLRPSGIALAVVTGLVTVFEKWAWRWRILRPWFVNKPDLNGTYKGHFRPVGAEDSPKEPTEMFITIQQTLSTQSVRLFTSESRSISLASCLDETSDDHWRLMYTYENVPNPTVRQRSPIHFGGVILNVDDRSCKQLSGSYWTDRQSQGELTFERISRDRARSFKEATEIAALPGHQSK